MKYAISMTLAGVAAVSMGAGGAGTASAQTAPGEGMTGQQLPPVVIEQQKAKAAPKAKKAAKKTPAAKPKAAAAAPAAPQAAEEGAGPAAGGVAAGPGGGEGGLVVPGTRSGSLTVPTEAEARAEINRTPGSVAVVSGVSYQANTPAAQAKDALDYVPGVLVRQSEGEASVRLSIRGSGLSRNADARGVQVLVDGVIPMTRAAGDTAFDEFDPSAYKYIEVYKGANALRWGANSLGGAINLVTPTGYDSDLFGARFDIGSFGFSKWAATSGGVYGAADYFVSVSALEEDGFRRHSDGENVRGFANAGFRITEDIETRFYFDAADTSRRFAGTVTKEQALSDPKTPFIAPGDMAFGPFPNTKRGNDNLEWNVGRDTDSLRVANKTSVRLAPGTTVEFGGFYVYRDRELRVFIFTEDEANEAGGFARLVDDHGIGGFGNRFVAGVNVHNGVNRRADYWNVFGQKGGLDAKIRQKADNTTVYAEDSLFVLPALAIVAGGQYAWVSREQEDLIKDQHFPFPRDDTSARDYKLFSPKIGFLWDVTPFAQVYGNISRSAEAPTFTETDFASKELLDPQKATTYEIGTRGNAPDFKWDVALYHSEIKNEFQCQTVFSPVTGFPVTGLCRQINIDQSMHQGFEAYVSAALAKGLFETGPLPDEIWLNAAYTFSNFHYVDDKDFGGNKLPGTPRHYLRAELLYKHPSGVYFGPNLEWVPEDYYVDARNSFSADSYAIWGAKLGFDNGGPVTAYIEGRNLSDTAYTSMALVASDATETSTLFYPGTGRAVYSGIQVRW